MSKIKVAAIQMKCSTNPKESLSHAEEMVREAAANGANVILLPELFEREYFCQQRRYDFYQYAETVEENKAVQMGMNPIGQNNLCGTEKQDRDASGRWK